MAIKQANVFLPLTPFHYHRGSLSEKLNVVPCAHVVLRKDWLSNRRHAWVRFVWQQDEHGCK